MFVPDMPNVPPQDVPVMIAQANQAQPSDVTTTRTIGVCSPVPNSNYSAENGLVPIGAAGFYLRSYEHQQVQDIGTVTVLQQPKHGVLRLVTQADGNNFGEGTFDPAAGLYVYLPEQGYLGNDKAVMLVEIAGVKVKVVYYFQAVEGPLGNYGTQDYCSKTGTQWKISSTLDANGTSTISSVDYVPADLGTTNTTLTSSSLDSWLSLAQLDGALKKLKGPGSINFLGME